MDTKTKTLTISDWSLLAEQKVYIPMHIVLHGSSMEPLIKFERDFVNIIPVQLMKRELMPGDIVLFHRADGAYVVHRLYQIHKEDHMVQTWGDNCYAPDAPIKDTDVLGLVISCEKKGKTIPLDTEKQRAYGKKWMNRSLKRRAWFRYRRGKEKLIAIRNKILGLK